MSAVFRSKIDVLLDQLRDEGKVTELSDAEVRQLDEHISCQMRPFRREIRRKQAQSEADTAKIILLEASK